MSGESDLPTLIASMTPVLDPNVYVFAKTKDAEAARRLPAVMLFEEAEAITVILTRSDAEREGLGYVFPCRRITLTVHSALEAVGFIAAIASALARHSMGVNPVAGFYHDHLFVPAERADDAMAVLTALSRSHAGTPP